MIAFDRLWTVGLPGGRSPSRARRVVAVAGKYPPGFMVTDQRLSHRAREHTNRSQARFGKEVDYFATRAGSGYSQTFASGAKTGKMA